jgi:hypothetical protein
MIDSQLLCHSSRIVNVAHRTTAGIALATPQTHRDTDHLVAFAT